MIAQGGRTAAYGKIHKRKEKQTMPSSIANLESGASVRTKLNDALAHNPLKLWRGTLVQSGASAPVATVFINTLGGTIVWSWSSTGDYRGTLAGAFPAGKTFLLIAQTSQNTYIRLSRVDANEIEITAQDGTFTLADNLLNDNAVEIAIYP